MRDADLSKDKSGPESPPDFRTSHLNAAIDDPRPAAGSFNMADVRRLSAHIIKLRDMPEGVLVLSGLSRVWKNRFCDPVLRVPMEMVWGRVKLFVLPFYCTPPTAAADVIPNPTTEDLAAGTPSSKILSKAEASQKRKASTFGADSSHVAKRTRFALAQSFGSTTRPSLFACDDDKSDDDDACIEILLVTPLRYAAVIPSSGNQGGSSFAPTTEGSNTRAKYSRGKGIMVDAAGAPSGGVIRQRPSSGLAPSFRDVFGDVIHTDFFPFSAGPYYATYLEDGVAGNYSRLKCYKEKVAGLTGLELQMSTLKKQVSGLNDKLATPDASFTKYEAKGKERKNKIKSLSKTLTYSSFCSKATTEEAGTTLADNFKDLEIGVTVDSFAIGETRVSLGMGILARRTNFSDSS
nr:hypothetical protein [Tanacetum cinerariifolium]